MKYNIKIDPRVRTTNAEIHKHWHLPIMLEFVGGFTEDAAKKFRQELSIAEDAALTSEQEILPIVIDSFGGDVYSLLSMIDEIENCKVPVATIVEGKAMSCGAYLFMCGTEGHRYIGPNATVMIHQVSGGSRGKVEDLTMSTKEAERLNSLVLEKCSDKIGKNKSFLYDLIKNNDHADLYLNAEDSVRHNIANKVGLPRFDVNVSLNFKFGL